MLKKFHKLKFDGKQGYVGVCKAYDSWFIFELKPLDMSKYGNPLPQEMIGNIYYQYAYGCFKDNYMAVMNRGIRFNDLGFVETVLNKLLQEAHGISLSDFDFSKTKDFGLIKTAITIDETKTIIKPKHTYVLYDVMGEDASVLLAYSGDEYKSEEEIIRECKRDIRMYGGSGLLCSYEQIGVKDGTVLIGKEQRVAMFTENKMTQMD